MATKVRFQGNAVMTPWTRLILPVVASISDNDANISLECSVSFSWRLIYLYLSLKLMIFNNIFLWNYDFWRYSSIVMEVNSPLNTKNVSTPIYPDKIIILRYFVAYWEFEKFHFMKRHSEDFALIYLKKCNPIPKRQNYVVT